MGCKSICCKTDKESNCEDTIEENLARLEIRNYYLCR